jgi:hypothetical protein
MKFLDYLHISLQGFFDALSFHKTLPILVNNPPTLYTILKIMGANVALIIGSEFLFRSGISPLVQRINTDVLEIKDLDQSTLYFLFQCLWLAPICVLCYVCCILWYQELADSIDKYFNTSANANANKSKDPTKDKISSLQNTIYAMITWVCAFAQAQLLTQIIPRVIDLMKGSESVSLFQEEFTFKSLIRFTIHHLLSLMKFSFLTAGCILMAILYAWYSFDPKWISVGKTAPERFALIEKYFFYFLGFGTPFVILIRSFSFFIGFGIYLTVFPFAVILGSILNYRKPYEETDLMKKGEAHPPVRIFKTAQSWAVSAIQMIGQDKQQKKAGKKQD